jgi:subtilisin family serine protease
LDTGIRDDHPHFKMHSNIAEQQNCTGKGDVKVAKDGFGHGSHVAGIIAGQYKVPRSPRTISGIAPSAKLHIYKVLDDDGSGRDSWIIKALDDIATKNEKAGRPVIHGLNLSLGGGFDPSVYACGFSPLCRELRRLWRQGVLVVIAAGNEGFAVLESDTGPIDANMDLSIGDPANLEDGIAVGSVHKENPHTYGISYFSSRGPTADGRQKPDLVAPGEKVISCRYQWKKGATAIDDLYVEMSGTSMATPHVSGILAAFLSVRREFIGEPDMVKRILLANCTDLARDRPQQGAGLPNLVKMLVNT